MEVVLALALVAGATGISLLRPFDMDIWDLFRAVPPLRYLTRTAGIGLLAWGVVQAIRLHTFDRTDLSFAAWGAGLFVASLLGRRETRRWQFVWLLIAAVSLLADLVNSYREVLAGLPVWQTMTSLPRYELLQLVALATLAAGLLLFLGYKAFGPHTLPEERATAIGCLAAAAAIAAIVPAVILLLRL